MKTKLCETERLLAIKANLVGNWNKLVLKEKK